MKIHFSLDNNLNVTGIADKMKKSPRESRDDFFFKLRSLDLNPSSLSFEWVRETHRIRRHRSALYHFRTLLQLHKRSRGRSWCLLLSSLQMVNRRSQQPLGKRNRCLDDLR